MAPQKIVYTDGHQVTITESFFQVKKTIYQLKGIIHHDFLVIHPYRLLALVAMLTGMVMALMALLRWLPLNSIPAFNFLSTEINGRETVLAISTGLLIMGIFISLMTRERYAIHLETAEGGRNVLVSKRKEYITQIIDALNKAFMSSVSPKESGKEKGGRKFIVGSR